MSEYYFKSTKVPVYVTIDLDDLDTDTAIAALSAVKGTRVIKLPGEYAVETFEAMRKDGLKRQISTSFPYELAIETALIVSQEIISKHYNKVASLEDVDVFTSYGQINTDVKSAGDYERVINDVFGNQNDTTLSCILNTQVNKEKVWVSRAPKTIGTLKNPVHQVVSHERFIKELSVTQLFVSKETCDTNKPNWIQSLVEQIKNFGK